MTRAGNLRRMIFRRQSSLIFMNSKIEVSPENMVSPKSLKKNAALNMTKTVMSLVFPLITFPYSSRVLGPVYIGKVNFAQSIVSYFALVAALGVSTYAVRESAKLRDDRKNLSVFVKEIFSLNMISTVIAYILFALALVVVPAFETYRILLCVCGAAILFTTLGMDWLYTGLEEFKYITVRSVAFQFISLILLFVFVKNQNDYLKYAGISVLSSVGSNICNFIHARHFVDFRVKALSLKKHLKPVFTLFAMSAAVSIYTVLDTTMLGLIKGDEAVGIYTAATKINRMVIMMITAATAVLLPRLSYYADKDRNEFLRLANKAVQFVVMFSVPCAAGLFVLAEPAVIFFSGEQFLPAIPVMKIMNAVIVFISLGCLMGGNVLISAGKEKSSLASTVVGAVSNFSLNLIFIPRYGAAGAAIGTVCAEFLVMTTQFILGRKIIDWKNLFRIVVQVFAAVFVMVLVLLFLMRFIKRVVPQIIFCIVLGFFLYAGTMILFRNELILNFFKIIRRKKSDI